MGAGCGAFPAVFLSGGPPSPPSMAAGGTGRGPRSPRGLQAPSGRPGAPSGEVAERGALPRPSEQAGPLRREGSHRRDRTGSPRPGGGLAHSFRPKEGATAVGLEPPGGLRGRGVIGNSAARRQHSPGFSLPRRVMRNVAWKEKLMEVLLLSCLLCWSSLSHSCFWKAGGEARPQIWLPLTGVTRKVLIGLVCIKLGYLKWTLTCVFRVQFEVFHFFYRRVYT